jgi:hypothetical protein
LAVGGWLKFTVTLELEEQGPFVNVQVKIFVPYSETVTVEVGLLASGENVTVPVPLVRVQIPFTSALPDTACRTKLRLQTLPPEPAFATGA